MKKFFAFVICASLAFPAVADNISESIFGANSNDVVQCSVDVLGESENESLAMTEAYWILNTYNCAAGQYLYTDTTNNIAECRECPTNHYCGGGTFSVESVSDGSTPCPNNTFAAAGTTTISECVTPKFTLTIDSSKASTTGFSTNAYGTFYVDWGDGTIQKIVRPNSGQVDDSYSHTYATTGIYTMRMSGQATGYYTGVYNTQSEDKYNTYESAILFEDPTVVGISGSLGSIFSTIDNGGTLDKQPRFKYTFNFCSNLTGTIPSNLFSGVHGTPVRDMFMGTFQGTKLTGSIPETLFCQNTNNPNATNCVYGTPAPRMFQSTFASVSSLTGSIPAKLFAGIHGAPAEKMFVSTFYNATGLTGAIPGTLFCQNPSNPDATNCIYGAPAIWMFFDTFDGCSGLSGTNIDDPNNPGKKYAIPPTLFAGIHGAPAGIMFEKTFANATGLTGTIPGTLFCQNPNTPDATNCIHGAPAIWMFQSTFDTCSNLTGSIPETLFAGIHGAPALRMFSETFYGCNKLTGTIPEKLFCQNPDNPNSQNCVYGQPADFMFAYFFYGCSGLTGTIPEKLFAGIRGTTAQGMFANTFGSDTNLTGSIPNKLFGELSGTPAFRMFEGTFRGDSKLTGYIPTDLFGTISGTRADRDFSNIFDGTGLETSCPANEYRHYFEFQNSFSSKVGCDVCPNNGSSPAGSLTVDACYINCDATQAIANGIRTLIGDNPTRYYSNGAYGACEYTTSCDNGYHVDTNACIANVINVIWYGADENNAYYQNTCNYDDNIVLPSTEPTKTGYTFDGWRLRQTQQQPEQQPE